MLAYIGDYITQLCGDYKKFFLWLIRFRGCTGHLNDHPNQYVVRITPIFRPTKMPFGRGPTLPDPERGCSNDHQGVKKPLNLTTMD